MATIVNPMTGRLEDTYPDEVNPNQLPTQSFDQAAVDRARAETGVPGVVAVTTNDPAGVTREGPQLPPNVMDTGGPMGSPPSLIGSAQAAPAPPPPLSAAGAMPSGGAPPAPGLPPASAVPAPYHAAGGAPRAPAGPPEVQTAEERNALAMRRGAESKERAAVTAQTGAEQQRATAEVDAAKREQEVVGQANVDADKKRAEASSYLAAERQKVRDYKPTDIWEGREAARVTSWVMAGIGEFASKLSGGPNTALNVLNGAVESWARKEHARYERLVKNGEMAQQQMADVDLEIKNKRAGILENLANQRRLEIARTMGPEAAAKGDFLVAQLEKQAATEDVQTATSVQERINKQKELDIKERLSRAQMAEAGASAARSRAEVGKIQAETKVIEAAGPMGAGKGMGRAAGKMIDLALLSNQQRDDVETLGRSFSQDPRSLAKLSAALATVQKNETTMHAMGKASEGPVGAFLVNSARDAGLAPRTVYKGVGEREQSILRAADLLATKAAEALAHTEGERAGVKASLMPRPDDPPGIIKEKIENLLSQTGATTALSGQFGTIAREGATREKAQMPGAVTEGGTRVRVRNAQTGQTIDAIRLPNGRLVQEVP